MLSVIIPTLNEEKCIVPLLNLLSSTAGDFEVIIVDGGSTDDTLAVCKPYGFSILSADQASRAYQMNFGAKAANGDVLYFVHADTVPPRSFLTDINYQISMGSAAGCYRFRFMDKPSPMLFLNDFFTRFPFSWCRGGDQTFFIRKSLFKQLGGYNEDFVIMEDFELYDRIKNEHVFKVIPKSVRVSARKYQRNSYLKVQMANYRAMKMYRSGVKPETIKQFYTQVLR